MDVKKIKMKVQTGTQDLLFYPETSSDQVRVGEQNLDEALAESLSYTNPVPMLKPIGGYEAGTTFNNLKLADFLTGLLYPYVPPKVTLSGTPTGIVRDYNDPITSIILTATATQQSNPLVSVEFFKGSTSIYKANLPINSTIPLTVTETLRQTTSFQVKVSDGIQTTSSKNLTYTFVYPFYVGKTTAATIDAFMLSASDKVVQAKGNVSKAYTTSQERFFIAYPASYGHLTTVLDANQFNILSDFMVGEKIVTMSDATTVPYRVYLFKNVVSVTNFTVMYQF